jgi:hypothetical protein
MPDLDLNNNNCFITPCSSNDYREAREEFAPVEASSSHVTQTFTAIIAEQKNYLRQINVLHDAKADISMTDSNIRNIEGIVQRAEAELIALPERITRPPEDSWIFTAIFLLIFVPFTATVGFGFGAVFGVLIMSAKATFICQAITATISGCLPVISLRLQKWEHNLHHEAMSRQNQQNRIAITRRLNRARVALERARVEKVKQEADNEVMDTNIARLENKMVRHLGIAPERMANIIRCLRQPNADIEHILLNNSEVVQQACLRNK